MWTYQTSGPGLAPPGFAVVTNEAPFKPGLIPLDHMYWCRERSMWATHMPNGEIPEWCFYWDRPVCARWGSFGGFRGTW